MAELYDRVAHALPGDHSRQASLDDMLQARLDVGWRPTRVLSLEGDAGRTAQRLRPGLVGAGWVRHAVPGATGGADDAPLPPLPPDGFDLVLVALALERVRDPDRWLQALRQVLRPGGLLLGQATQFEALGQGVWRQYTVYGLHRVLEDAGWRLLELRPGIDGFTLLRRAYEGRPGDVSRYFAEESPFNAQIEVSAQGRRPAIRNFRKLVFAGQILFAAGDGQSPAARPQPEPPRRAPPAARPLAPPPFDGSGDYWRRRYRQGQDSGAGSYGKFADFKAEVLNAVFAELGLRCAVEFGCGDGHQLGLLRIERYVGTDISPEAIARCRARYGGDPGRRFVLDDDYDGVPADAALSLDVIYHLVEDEVYERYMRRLFAGATALVAVYASNVDDADTGVPHVRHRRFVDWVQAHAPGWRLWRHVPNRHPWQGDHREGSFADFYLFRPAERMGS